MTAQQKSLVVAGAVLFLLGLLQGAVVQYLANPRMALSAHLTAVQSGMALMIAGLLWSHVALQARTADIARLTVVVGMYGLWLGLTVAAVTGAHANLPIAGAGQSADVTSEMVSLILILGSSGLMTIGWLLFVIGLARR